LTLAAIKYKLTLAAVVVIEFIAGAFSGLAIALLCLAVLGVIAREIARLN
jgi:hypothetical protein